MTLAAVQGTAHVALRAARALARRLLGRGFPARSLVEQSNVPNLARRARAEGLSARRRPRSGPRVLVATSMGGYSLGALVESVLGVALTLRGADVDLFLCDSALPGCQLTEIAANTPQQVATQRVQPRCLSCEPVGRELFKQLGLPVRFLGQLVTRDQRREARELAARVPLEEVGTFRWKGQAVGEHALAGALRYFARGTLPNDGSAEMVLRRYLESALVTAFSARRLLREGAYDVACFNHGLYVPQGIIGEACRHQGVRVVNWNPAYRKHSFIFSHGDTYHHTMISEPTTTWEHLDWTPEMEKETLSYLKSRWYGTQDWIWFHERPEQNLKRIEAEVGLNFSKPLVSMLTNVMWDAQLHYPSNAFPSMLDWVLETVRYFASRPELQLAIRVHPAEVRGAVPSRQPLVDEIRRAYPSLPGSVFVVPPESQVSTYALAEQSQSVLIYNTKTGIEVTSMGIPTVVAGEAWIRGKGLSYDATTRDEYFALLARLPLPPLDSAQRQRALKYAYHFFFRRMIPLPFVVPGGGFGYSLALPDLAALQPGNYPGLDVVCDGILRGTPFVYPAERFGYGSGK